MNNKYKLSLLLLLILHGSPLFAKQNPTQIATQCLNLQLDLWEREKGRLPNEEEAALIIDYCAMEAFNEKTKPTNKPTN